MIKENFVKINDYLREIPKDFRGDMRVPARVYASENIWKDIEEDALKQLVNTSTLPGIIKYVVAMPDIHSGYGPPIGGVGALRLSDGVISPGFVGYDENCAIRLLKSEYTEKEIKPYLEDLLTEIQREVPSGLGKGRQIKLSIKQIDEILEGGVPKLVEQGYGEKEDIDNCEEKGRMEQADANCISQRAKIRGRDQIGTLGSGNHFCSIEKVSEIYDEKIARVFGLFKNQAVVMIHTGSRGLGHQNCTDYLKIVMQSLPKYNIELPDKELACAPFNSPEGQSFFKAMSAASNYAWANRHMITHYIRNAWKKILSEKINLKLLYDVAHNIAKIEDHEVDGEKIKLIVHRKGAIRAFPAGHLEIPEKYREVGQPVLIPGTMGTASYILVGAEQAQETFFSVCHGAGRVLSRHAAIRQIQGSELRQQLEKEGIIVRCLSNKGLAEEAPLAYKDIHNVVDAVVKAGLAKLVARLRPMGVVKG